MNSRMKYTTVKYRCAYGFNQEVQLEVQEEMEKNRIKHEFSWKGTQ